MDVAIGILLPLSIATSSYCAAVRDERGGLVWDHRSAGETVGPWALGHSLTWERAEGPSRKQGTPKRSQQCLLSCGVQQSQGWACGMGRIWRVGAAEKPLRSFNLDCSLCEQ